MSKEAKPIVVIYYNPPSDGTEHWRIQEIVEEKWPDYHPLVVPNPNQERVIELEVFYDKDFTDTNYEDLKKWITEYITPTKT